MNARAGSVLHKRACASNSWGHQNTVEIFPEDTFCARATAELPDLHCEPGEICWVDETQRSCMKNQAGCIPGEVKYFHSHCCKRNLGPNGVIFFLVFHIYDCTIRSGLISHFQKCITLGVYY